jgi:dipeptidyl aminopeptidase/acylaminoacyl peptidase
VAITALDQAQQETKHWWPQFLPDGKHYLYFVQSSQSSNGGIFVGLLDSKERKRLIGADSKGVYVEPGYLLFARAGAVFAQPFDATQLVLSGEAIRVADPITFNGVFAAFDASRNGSVLTYRIDPNPQAVGGLGAAGGDAFAPDRPLVWVDRSGKRTDEVGNPDGYVGVDLSPDGKRLAVHRHDGDGGDVWILDAAQAGAPVRLTFDATQDNSSPIWSPDGARVAFASLRQKKWGLYIKAADGTAREELVTESETAKMPMSWSPDGKVLVYQVMTGGAGADQWAVPLTGDKKPFPLLQSPAVEVSPQISPDGKWIAYSSNETANIFQIYVKPFPDGPGQWQVSTEGGYFPRWRRDGKELYFMTGAGGITTGSGGGAGAGTMMAVDIRVAGSAVQPGVPRALFPSGYGNTGHPTGIRYNAYAVSADGQRFLIPQLGAARRGTANTLADDIAQRADAGGAAATTFSGNTGGEITVDLNWMSVLKRSGRPK